MKIRPNRRVLAKQKDELVKRIGKKLSEHKIGTVKIFGRIKTLGSIDRKLRFRAITSPENRDRYMKSDLIGIRVVVGSKKECYAVLDALKALGKFPELSHKKNPRDYFEEPYSPGSWDLVDSITGNFVVEGFNPVHIMIFTEKSHFEAKIRRKKIKKKIWYTIKSAEQRKN